MSRTALVRWAVGLAVVGVGVVLSLTRWPGPAERPPPAPPAPREPRVLPRPGLGADAFPWNGLTVLTDPTGATLSWNVERVEGEVWVTGSHPHWQVEHRARPDGTPLFTARNRGGAITRVFYSAQGAQVEHSDSKGRSSRIVIQETDLWDGDTLDVRLAGLPWQPGQQVHLRIVDVDLADGTVYPLVAEYVGEERCAGEPCFHVHLALDDFRRGFAPSFDYRYATEEGARYLQFDGDGMTFRGR